VVSEFVDQESGATDERPQFQAMFQAASRGLFDVLLFWSLNHLSREGVYETLSHLNRLTGYGVYYRSFTEQWFGSYAIFREAVISIMATLAKQERVRNLRANESRFGTCAPPGKSPWTAEGRN
jgi:DNA invertase Pin-like site-specific DNA recombinase